MRTTYLAKKLTFARAGPNRLTMSSCGLPRCPSRNSAASPCTDGVWEPGGPCSRHRAPSLLMAVLRIRVLRTCGRRGWEGVLVGEWDITARTQLVDQRPQIELVRPACGRPGCAVLVAQ